VSLSAIFFTIYPIIDVPSPLSSPLKIIAVTELRMRSASPIFAIGKKDADLGKPNHDLVLRCILCLGSTGRWLLENCGDNANSGEHRPLACSSRQLAAKPLATSGTKVAPKMHIGCSRMLQASGLCSPDTECIATLGHDGFSQIGVFFSQWRKLRRRSHFAIPVTAMIFTAKLNGLGTSIIG